VGREIATVGPREPTSDDNADCAVVIVTYNNAGDLPALLASLDQPSGGRTVRTVVVDNRSGDGTAEVAESAGADCVVRSERNLGYAGGINEGCRTALASGAQAILVLNPDLRLEPRAVATLLDALWTPGVGAVVPRLTDPEGRTLRSQRREPTLGRAIGDAILGSRLPARPHWSSEEVRSDWAYERTVAVDWATGAAIMVRADVAETVGDWDEAFFMYSEEVDYCRRIRATGARILYVPDAVAVHAEGGSGRSEALTALLALNGVRAYATTHSRVATAAFRLVVAVGELARMHKPGRLHAAMVVLGLSAPPSFPEAPTIARVPW
jgi:GT2 family glycosyltransferase